MTAITTSQPYKGFRKGMAKVLYKDYRAIVADINAALGVNNRQSFYEYRDGYREPKMGAAAQIEATFSKYGITDIWD